MAEFWICEFHSTRKSMIVRLAQVYVRTLFMVEVLLFAASLLLHLSVFIVGQTQAYAKFGMPLFRATVIIGIPVTAFVVDGNWLNQIKICPKWMWKGSLTIGIYALLITCVQTVFSEGAFFEQALAVSGLPLGFDAISICVLNSVRRPDYLKQSEIVRRALHSVVFAALGVIVFLAYHAGYLHHQARSAQ